jgi:hypothetical protein
VECWLFRFAVPAFRARRSTDNRSVRRGGVPLNYFVCDRFVLIRVVQFCLEQSARHFEIETTQNRCCTFIRAPRGVISTAQLACCEPEEGIVDIAILIEDFCQHIKNRRRVVARTRFDLTDEIGLSRTSAGLQRRQRFVDGLISMQRAACQKQSLFRSRRYRFKPKVRELGAVYSGDDSGRLAGWVNTLADPAFPDL